MQRFVSTTLLLARFSSLSLGIAHWAISSPSAEGAPPINALRFFVPFLYS